MNDLPRVTYSNTGRGFLRQFTLISMRLFPEAEARLLGKIRPALIGGRDRKEGRDRHGSKPDRPRYRPRRISASRRGAWSTRRSRQPERPFQAGAIWAGRGASRSFAPAADVLEERKWDVSVACLIEVGKSRLEAVGEVEEAIDLIRHYCAEMERTDGFREERPGASRAEQCSVVLRPFGVFGVIAPFNFPVALSIGMISAALVAGNTVVFKPSDAAGLTGRLRRRSARCRRACPMAC